MANPLFFLSPSPRIKPVPVKTGNPGSSVFFSCHTGDHRYPDSSVLVTPNRACPGEDRESGVQGFPFRHPGLKACPVLDTGIRDHPGLDPGSSVFSSLDSGLRRNDGKETFSAFYFHTPPSSCLAASLLRHPGLDPGSSAFIFSGFRPSPE